MKRKLFVVYMLVFVFSVLVLKNCFCDFSGLEHCGEFAHIHNYSLDFSTVEESNLIKSERSHESDCHEGKVSASVFTFESQGDKFGDSIVLIRFKLDFFNRTYFSEMYFQPNRRPPKSLT